MYNQVSGGPHFGQGGSHPPMPPPPPPNVYQQQQAHQPPPPPPPHFQQAALLPVPPGPHAYIHGPPNAPSMGPGNHPFQVPPGVMQSAGQYGNSMVPQAFASVGQNSQHSSDSGVQSHHVPAPVPPPHPLGHSHQESSWASGPPSRVLPPPPPLPASSQGQILYKPPFVPPPPQPGDLQSLQHGHNTLPPPPPAGYVGNYQVPSVAPPPPLPSSPPPILPSPPPPVTPMTSASSHAVHSDPKSGKVSGSELKSVDSVDKVVASYLSGIAPVCNSDTSQDGGSCREVAAADRDELSSNRSVNLYLPLPPPQPIEGKTVQKIEALCQLIAENGPDIEDKVRREEFQNPEYKFLFGGDPGTEAAISHAYFLWMKKKYNLEHRWHETKSESRLRPLAVDSTGPRYHLHVATESADSDMEMEDDITLSDKDQGPNCAIEALTQQCHWVGEEFSVNENVHQLQNSTENEHDKDISVNENIHQLQNSTENDHAKDILSSGASCFGSIGVSKQHEGPAHFSDSEHIKSARSVTKVHSLVNDSSEVAEFPLGTVLEKSAAPLAEDFTRNGTPDLIEATNPDRDSGQLIRSGSPIRLLQDYASDDRSDNEDETVSAGAATGVSVTHKDSGSYLGTDIGSKSPFSSQKGFGQLSKTARNDSEVSKHLVQESRGRIEDNHENQVSVAAYIEVFKGKEELGGTCIDNGSKNRNAEQEDERKASEFEQNILKVDKFGRHPKEAPTDSDSESDDYHYRQTKRVSKRGRGRSRSRSPLGRGRSRSRRRRKSPWRRRDKRSRSRSWSPQHRRSRSRSPVLRRTGDCSGENVKKDRGQCFAFLRGKCYRGASCRYIHQGPEKNASLRRHRNKHDQEVYSHAKNSRMNERTKNISSEVSDHECDGIKCKDADPCQNVTGQVEKRKEDSVRDAIVSATSGMDSQSVSDDPIKSESSREAAPEMKETLVLREEPNKSIRDKDSFEKAVNSHQQLDGFCPEALGGGDALKPSGGTYEDIIRTEDGSSVHQVQPNVPVGISEHSGYPSQLINASFVSDSSDKISMISSVANKVSSTETLPYMLPSTQLLSATSSVCPWLSSEQPLLHSQASKELTPHSSSSVEVPPHAYQLPPPPIVSHAQGENAVHLPQISREYGLTQQNALFPFQSTTREKFEPYPAPLHTHKPHFSVPPNYSWTSLPPPPPPSRAVYNSNLNSEVATSYVSLEFNQSQLHSRGDFVSQTSAKPGLPSHSQSSEFQDQAYPPMQDHSRTFMLTEPFSPKHLPQGNPANQLISGPNLNREDHYKQFPMQDSKLSSSGGLHPQQKQYSWQSDASRLQPSFGGKLPPEDHFKTSSHIHPSSQKLQSIYNFQYSASEGNLGVLGETVTSSRYPPDVLDSNHSTSLPSFGGSRISAHYNPYASTFEQPISSKFTSSIFRQESDIIHGSNYGSSRLNPIPISREGIDDVGSRQLVSSPNSARAVGQILPRLGLSGGKQYDPLFDSIEPPSSSLKKFDFDQKQEVTGESNISLRPKSSYMSLDVEEQNKHEEVGAVASTTSQNNDEFGETADAEVGAVENESLSNHVDVANMTTGEDEINQSKSPGKKKKSKDSRSMKLFKSSIANFVKDVLKPSWRQGNMSKVAFKTIVKKTVDKVSGAMKGHRIPKSQAKISQYIDSSQRKLTKLVMGYVDKYVKA